MSFNKLLIHKCIVSAPTESIDSSGNVSTSFVACGTPFCLLTVASSKQLQDFAAVRDARTPAAQNTLLLQRGETIDFGYRVTNIIDRRTGESIDTGPFFVREKRHITNHIGTHHIEVLLEKTNENASGGF